jgi:hypothetical protein
MSESVGVLRATPLLRAHRSTAISMTANNRHFRSGSTNQLINTVPDALRATTSARLPQC